MSLRTTCPDCGTTYRVADATRGKKIRCSRCKTVFIADAADNGKDGYAIKPTPPQPKSAAPRVARKPIVRHDFEDEEEASFEKKNSSMLPYLLLGIGLVVLLCAGLPIVGYVVWQAAEAEEAAQAEAAEQERAVAARERAARAGLDEDPMGEQARQRVQEAFDKAQADHERQREEMQKRIAEDMQEADRFHKDVRQRIQANMDEQRRLIQKRMEKLGPGNPPLNPFDPAASQAPREMVQVVSRSIPLAVQPQAVVSVLWTAADSKQAVIVRRTDRAIGLDRYDLASGRKLDSMDSPLALLLSSIRDVSPDGKYYLCNVSRTSYSIWSLPDPKPIVQRWLPPSFPHKGAAPGRHDVAAAYLLSGSRLLTVNDAGQAAFWSLPKAGGKPALQRSFTPEAAVARYTAPLVDRGIAISPDRTRLAIFNGSDGFLVLDTDSLQLQGVVTSPEDALPATDPMRGIFGAAFSPDGQQLAALINSQSSRPGATPKENQLIRWDVKTRQRTARFAERSKNSAGAGSRIAWWGNDHVWVASTLLPGSLISWDKQRSVLDAALRAEEKVCFGNTDGKCWFLVTAPDGTTVLKCVDLPADALQKAGQPLELTKDGIVR